jgi:hypothetical protein
MISTVSMSPLLEMKELAAPSGALRNVFPLAWKQTGALTFTPVGLFPLNTSAFCWTCDWASRSPSREVRIRNHDRSCNRRDAWVESKISDLQLITTRALVGDWWGFEPFSARAKWRSSTSACGGVLLGFLLFLSKNGLALCGRGHRSRVAVAQRFVNLSAHPQTMQQDG